MSEPRDLRERTWTGPELVGLLDSVAGEWQTAARLVRAAANAAMWHGARTDSGTDRRCGEALYRLADGLDEMGGAR